MNIQESNVIKAAIARTQLRDHHAPHGWVWENPSQAIVVAWDGDNEIEIAERAILLGAEAQKKGINTIFQADHGGSTFFFLDDEPTVVASLNASSETLDCAYL